MMCKKCGEFHFKRTCKNDEKIKLPINIQLPIRQAKVLGILTNKWRSANQLGVSAGTLNALVRKNLAEKKQLNYDPFCPYDHFLFKKAN